MTVHLTKYLGFQLKRDVGSDGRVYLWGVIWYLRSPNRLGYFYPSIRWF